MLDPKKIAREEKDLLKKWLDDAKYIKEITPEVKKRYDYAVWQEETLSNAPDPIERKIPDDLTISLEQDLGLAKQVLPNITNIAPEDFSTVSATSSGTSSKIYQIAEQAKHSDDVQTSNWGTNFSDKYEELQKKQEKEKQVRDLLFNLKSDLADEFDEAVSAYRNALVEVDKKASAGIAMRNVLGHYKGEIMVMARSHKRQQKVTWEQMANKLTDDSTVARERFIDQESAWNKLQQGLSKIAKRDANQPELKSVYTEFIDHLYIVLTLIKQLS